MTARLFRMPVCQNRSHETSLEGGPSHW